MTGGNGGYILRRVLTLVPMLLILSVVVFTLIHVSPGDPAKAMAGEGALDPVLLQQIRENLGLDRPIYVQYVIWLGKILQLDFGTAYSFNRTPVLDLIGQRVWPTVILQSLALIVAMSIALPLGVLSARRAGSAFDQSSQAFSVLGICIPDFWLAVMLQLFFAVSLRWLPVSTWGAGKPFPDRALHFILPVIVLAVPIVAIMSRYIRASMVNVIHQDYVMTARAKGLAERRVIYVHALRNGLIPVVTVTGAQVARLLSGSVIVESIFAWPGLGSLAFEAILRRDFPVILALTLITGALVLVVNVIVDILYALLDPRVSFQ